MRLGVAGLSWKRTIAMKIKFANNSRYASGTTLAEVTVSVAILAIMAAGIIGSFNYGFFVMGLARENQRATQILLKKTETIRLYNWDQVLGGDVQQPFTEYYDPQSSTNKGILFSGTVDLVAFPFTAPYSTNMRQVNITLTWTNANSRIVRHRSLSTVMARYGMQNYVY